MPSRTNVPTLRNLCLSYVSSNIDIWQKKTDTHSDDNIFASLPDCLLDDIFIVARHNKRLLPRHLDLIIHKNSNELDFSPISCFGNQDDLILRGIELIGNLCINLTHLNISHASIDTDQLKKLAMSIPAIQFLNLRNTATTDDVLFLLGDNCPELNDLDISACEAVTDIGMSALCLQSLAPDGRQHRGRCHLIQGLYIQNTAITEEGAKIAICNLPLLTEFGYINSLKVVENIYRQNSSTDMQLKLENLNHVDCMSDDISNFTINAASQLCQNVTRIALTDIKSNDQWLMQLTKFPQLADLSLMGPSFDVDIEDYVSYQIVEPLLKEIGSNLTVLKLSFMSNINLWNVGIYCTKLSSMTVSNNVNYVSTYPQDRNIPQRIFAELTTFRTEFDDWSPNHDIPEIQLENLLSNCQQLQSLRITGCRSLTDELLLRVFECNPLSELDIVDVRECDRIGKSSILLLIDKCNSLSHLCYKQCFRISPDDDDEIREFVRKENIDLNIVW